MKKILSLSLWILFSVAIWLACKKNVEDDPFLKVETKTLSFTRKASSKELLVKTNIEDWVVEIPSEANGWLTATKKGETLKVDVQINNDATRETILKIKGKGLVQEVKVFQLGNTPEILLNFEGVLKIQKITEKIELIVTANVEYEIEFPQWMTHVSKTPLEGENEKFKHVFNVSPNTGEASRTGTLKVQSKGLSNPITKRVIITQTAGYEDNDTSSIEGDIKLQIARGETSSQQNGSGEVRHSYDGDLNTIYHSNWSNGGSNYFPITLEYFFESPQDVDYMVYYPRTEGSNGHFKQVEIHVATQQNPAYKKVTDFDFKGNGKVTRVPFNRIAGAKSFKLIIKSGHGDGQGFASAAEIEFWKKNTEGFNPTAIFTDITCSELKSGVTDEQIENIENPFYKNIARYMKNNEYPSEFRVQTYRAWPNPEVYRQRNRMQYAYSNLDNPTGISAIEGEEMVVLVGPTQGREIQIKIQNLNKPNGDGFNEASYHPLYEGVNKFKAGKSGLIYLQYQTPDYESAPKIKVHFATGKVNGYFDKTKHTEADWNRLINSATNKYFDVIGEKAHICFPVESYKTYTGSRGKELIDVFDRLVEQTHIFAGTTKENGKELPNRAYFQVMYTSFMYCTSYRTSYNVSTMSTLCDPDKMGNASDKKQTSVWGPAHEIGHAHQVAPTFMWAGLTECTVNMNSMNIQTAWGIPPRLEVESMGSEGGYNNRYEKAFNIGIVPKKSHADFGDVFCKLVPFWQLNLYFSMVKQDPNFSVKMYNKLRDIPVRNPVKHGECQVDFTKIMSELTGTNLRPFFERWGFYVPINIEIDDYGKKQLVVEASYASQIKNEIDGMGLPQITDKIEYISDSNWTYFRDKANVVKGTATKNGRRVTTSGWKNVVAYEVYQGNDLIFVSSKDSFTLKNDITANTRIFAIAYDGQRTEVTF